MILLGFLFAIITGILLSRRHKEERTFYVIDVPLYPHLLEWQLEAIPGLPSSSQTERERGNE